MNQPPNKSSPRLPKSLLPKVEPVAAAVVEPQVKPVAAELVEPKAESEADTIARLAKLSSLEYDRLRREEAKVLGIQVKTLDDLVKASRKGSFDAEQAPFTDSEPCGEPVDPCSLLNELAHQISKYVVIEPEQADAAALWITHTYLVDVIDVSPLAIINAPEKACAKTLMQTVIGTFCYRPLPASNATVSALFRAVEHWRPTMLIDEADTFFRDMPDLHGLVNAGYKRGGFVLRSEVAGDSFQPRMFSVYSPKSIAGIALEKHLPESTMSRGIILNLRKKLPHEKVERFRNADRNTINVIRSKLARFALDFSQAVSEARPTMPDKLSDREQDNWEGLFAIAGCAGEDWVLRAENAALKLSASSEALSSPGNELLRNIRTIFLKEGVSKICTADLLIELTADAEQRWATYNAGRPITPRQLAKLLDAYNIKPKTVRMGAYDTPKGYERSQFEDAFARYLPEAEIVESQW